MKKALALLLVVVLALGMSTTVFAASGPINKADPTSAFSSADISKNGKDDLAPGDSLELVLTQDMFDSDTDAVWATTGDAVAKTDITKSKVSIRSKVKKGSVAIDSVKLDYFKTAKSNDSTKIVVELVDPFKSNNTDGLDFEVDVYFVIDGKAFPSVCANFYGTLINDVTEIDKDTYYVYMADGAIAKVEEYVKEVEYELMSDGGVLLYGPAIKNAKYWGIADNEPTAAQLEVMDKYDIDEVINMSVIGLDRIAKKVTLSIANPSDYVYDGDLKYLGRASDDLPFANTYYLATKMLDVETDEEPEDEDLDDTDAPEAPEDLGGDGYPENVNDNPGTGK